MLDLNFTKPETGWVDKWMIEIAYSDDLQDAIKLFNANRYLWWLLHVIHHDTAIPIDVSVCCDWSFPSVTNVATLICSCQSGTCVNKRWVCDGYADCPAGDDESEAQCGASEPGEESAGSAPAPAVHRPNKLGRNKGEITVFWSHCTRFN